MAVNEHGVLSVSTHSGHPQRDESRTKQINANNTNEEASWQKEQGNKLILNNGTTFISNPKKKKKNLWDTIRHIHRISFDQGLNGKKRVK